MIGTIEEIIKWLFGQDRKKLYEIKEYKEKRSSNANAYAWKLITEIGNKMNLSKEEVYLKMLEAYGQSEMVSIVSDVDVKGYFKYYKLAGNSELNDKVFNHYIIYKGTSEYNTKEMSIFIDGVVQEAQQLGIDTRTPEQIEELKRLWKIKEN